MTEAQAIAKQLGEVKPDDEWLQAEIAPLKGKSIVPLQQVKLSMIGWMASAKHGNPVESLGNHGLARQLLVMPIGTGTSHTKNLGDLRLCL